MLRVFEDRLECGPTEKPFTLPLSQLFDVSLNGSSFVTHLQTGRRQATVEQAHSKLLSGRAHKFTVGEALFSSAGDGRVVVKITGGVGMMEFRVIKGYRTDAVIPFFRTLLDWANANQERSHSEEHPQAVVRPIEILDGGGQAPPPGTSGVLNVYDDRIELGGLEAMVSVPLGEISSVRLTRKGLSSFVPGAYVDGTVSEFTPVLPKNLQQVWVGIVADAGWFDIRVGPTSFDQVKVALRVIAQAASSYRGDGPTIESPSRKLGPIRVLDGAGWAPKVGTIGSITLYSDRVDIGPPGQVAVIANSAVTEVRVDGHSVSSGGGFIGGGSTAKSAAKGIVVASALNALSSSTSEWVTVKISSADGWVELRIDNLDAIQARNALRHLSDSAAERSTRDESSGLPSVPDPHEGENDHSEARSALERVSALERLAALHASGALNDREFLAAKSDLLGLGE
jgi:hypothetical protein